MGGCQVLRCQGPVETVVTDNYATVRREYAACVSHAAEIAGGAEWRVDRSDRARPIILMGSDLDDGELCFSGFLIETQAMILGSSEEPRHILTVKAKRRGSEAEETLSFEITRANFARLAKSFAEYDKEPPLD